MGIKSENKDRMLDIIVICDAELADIIPDYLEGRRDECAFIRENTLKGAFDQVRSIAHGIKGSGGSYGFNAITEIGGAMEKAAKDENRVEVLMQLDKLQDFLAAVVVHYE